ncbi:DUF4398 domain-containing protein [Halorussus salilacus]|uniref:DUF4398 domain-containing protein n=1 Tax=Halorussus salilacus TaxID=2953750 RepID=UPI00209D7820|nr:DUF4398 domain-containing protein [Halorussus salilacus]USZ67323.1 DUF4398 domain-containing protein [Halorussus salilacus]
MNSNHCSKLLTLLVAIALVASAATPAAAAVSASASGAPDSAEVGEEVTSTFTLDRPFSEYDEWTLNGETELEGVTWTVKLYDQGGDKIGQESYDGESFNHTLQSEDNAAEVEVTIEGTVAEVEDFTYDPAQQHLLAELNQVREGGSSDTIDSWEFRPYTADSDEARSAIEDAETAIADAEDSGAGVSDAEDKLDDAVSAYDGENFDLAVELAGEATDSADSAEQSNQQTQMLLYGGVGLVVLVAIIGGVLWYRSQQDDYDKLR